MAETGIPEIDGEYLRQLTDAAIAAAEEDGYQRGLAERDERVRSLEAEVTDLQLEIGNLQGDSDELASLGGCIHIMRTTFSRNRHAQEWADFIEEHVNVPGTEERAASAPAGERLSPADASTACARCGILGTLHGATPPHTRGDTCVGFLAASAPAGELDQGAEHMGAVEFPGGGSSTTEASEVAATTANDATVPSPVRSCNFALSPPAEAPQESGVPSGIEWVCEYCGREVQAALAHADPTAVKCYGTKEKPGCGTVNAVRKSPSTLRGEYERMAREWLRADMMSLYYGVQAGATSNERRVASFTALLARVADERQREIVEALRNMANAIQITSAPDTTFHLIYDITNYIASNAWRAEGKKT